MSVEGKVKEAAGFVKVLTVKGTDHILGVTLVASHAGHAGDKIERALPVGNVREPLFLRI